MPGEFYFMSIGAIGVSLAGFAGLISALHRSPAATSAVAAYRIKGIVVLGFSLTFIGFGTVALYTATGGNLVLTVRLATGLCLLAHAWGFREARPGPQWRSEAERRGSLLILTVLVLLTLGNVVVGSVGYLELLLLFILFGPVSIFYNTVRDAGVLAQPVVTGRLRRPDHTLAWASPWHVAATNHSTPCSSWRAYSAAS